MTKIDKIYGTKEQHKELSDWIAENYPIGLDYIYKWNRTRRQNKIRPIAKFTCKIDIWLLEHCPIPWVLDRLKEQYGIPVYEDKELL